MREACKNYKGESDNLLGYMYTSSMPHPKKVTGVNEAQKETKKSKRCKWSPNRNQKKSIILIDYAYSRQYDYHA